MNTIWVLMAVAVLWVVAWAHVPAQAQGLGNLLTPAETGTPSEIDELMRAAAENGVSVVVIDSDGRVLNDIDTSAPAADAQGMGSSLMSMQDDAMAFRTALSDGFANLPASINEVLYILRATSPDGTIFAYFKVLFLSLGLLGVGILFQNEVYGKRIVKGFVVGRILEKPVGYGQKMPFLMFRFFMGLIGIVISMAVAFILGTIIFGPLENPALQFTATLINIAYFVIRVVTSTWRMILSPYLPQYRIPLLSDPDAKKLYLWLCVGTILGISTVLFGIWIRELGLNFDVYVFLYSLLSFVGMVQSILIVVFNWRAVTNAILNGTPPEAASWVLRTLSRLWGPISIAFFLFAWGEQTFHLVLGNADGVPLLVGGWIILTTIIVVYGVLNFYIERGFARRRYMREHQSVDPDDVDEDDVAPMGPPRGALTSFEDLARRIAGIIAFVAGSYAFIGMWSPGFGIEDGSIAARLLDVVVIIFLGYIGYYAFRIWIDRKIADEQGDMGEGELGDEGGGSSASRLATLLPLFRNFMLILIVLTIFLITLMEMGVNVGPLFAGAGILGVAVGFGSQSLVRDIFSGAFFLFDDAFRRGEYIDVGGVKGTVEKISVRSFQLRHHLGALHTMPFGEIQVLTNYSRDWVIMKLPLRVTYDTDVEKVRKMIKKLGVALLDDPVIGDNFIQPLKSQGVIEMQDSAMIIRVKFMTKPGDQWLVRKKVYEEIRELFAREGIKFAHREVTVRLADDKKLDELTEEDRKAITAAAQASIEEDLMEGGAQDGDDR
ncbi:mechanosensitive ion channel family protein [uncultured Tateyamaria sp.]|uniref:mechanosensitive ion channel family protein n=1 Tax=uncultured Tateyamaria sp. TaxID=455651 RepID=UPI002606B769|nr:mechanosensitive ion channel family protein [uncultured Tateyamaria sp.]